jgi:uncharacterized repeat protein (TIGR01451 family)
MARLLFRGSVVLAVLVLGMLGAEALAIPASHEAAQPATDVCGTIGSDTAWTAAASPYVVTCDVTVSSGVTLTVEPGVVVKFIDASMTLLVEGTLLADGTETDLIYFTSYADDVGGDTNGDGSASLPAPGQWDAIRFSANSTGNLLDHAVVRYGGSGNQPNIYSATSSLTIRNSTISNSARWGMYLDNVLLSEISNANFLDNAAEAVLAQDPNINGISTSLAGSTASGNSHNGLVVYTGNLDGTVTWDGAELFPFIVRNSLTINAGAQLILTAGTVVKFDWTGDRIWVHGTLFANGTETDQVFFTSLADDTVGGDTNNDADASSPAPGNWTSLHFTGTSTGNLLDHAVVRYGGKWGAPNIHSDSASLSIRNSTIAYSGGRGIYLENAIPNEISNTNFLDNATEAVYANNLNNNGDSTNLAGSTASGNSVNGLVVVGNLSGEPVWQSGEVFPIIVRGSLTINEPAHLTLTPGTIVKLESWSNNIWVHGTLTAGGTETEKIIFTSLVDDSVGGDTNGDRGASSPGPGNWSSIRFMGGSTGSLLDHTAVRYGAGSNSEIVYIATSAITVTNSTIAHSGDRAMYLDGGAPLIKDNTISDASIGIRVTNGCTATLQGNLIINNSSHGVLSEGGSTPTLRANSFAGNGSYGVLNIDPAVWVDARGNWWNSASGPYHPTLNPGGTGDAASDYVLFSPWLHAPPVDGVPPEELNVALGGPTAASPGEMVSYAAGYANWSSTTVEDAVLVLTLPQVATYVDSPGGGIYWPSRHEVFWRLGDLAPQAEGLFVVQARFLWGLPTGASNLATARLGSTNLDSGGLDVQPYLDYVPQVVTTRTPLTPGELLAERQAYPTLDAFCDEAEAEGMYFGLAQRLEWSDGLTTTEVIFVRPDEDRVTVIRREGEEVYSSLYNRGTYTIKHAYGGVALDLRTNDMSLFGDWDPTGGGQVSSLDGPPVDTLPSKRFLNCLTLKLPKDVLSRIGHLAEEIAQGKDCWNCVYETYHDCYGCAYQLGLEHDKDEEARDTMWQCGYDLGNFPDLYQCTEDYFTKGWGLGTPVYWFLGVKDFCNVTFCDPATGEYKTRGLWEYTPCRSWAYCKEGLRSEGGGCQLKDDICGIPQSRLQSARAGQPQQNTCATSESTVTPARDPNAKYGPIGDVLPGQVLTYTLECENVGEGTAYGVYIADELSEELDAETVAVHGGGERLQGTGLLVWDIGELAPKGEPGSTATVSFTVRLKDDLPSGTVIANDATVYFPSVPEETPTNAVVNVVQPLVARPQALETEAGQPLAITLEGVDAAGSPLTYTVVDEPLYGELTGVAPTLVYTAMTTFTGLDRFTFQVDNGITTSRAAEVTIRVHPWSGDTTPPEVVWTEPQDGEVIVELNASPVFTDAYGPAYGPFVIAGFSEAISAATVTTDTVQLEDEDGKHISGTVAYGGTLDEAWMVLRSPLAAATRYTATVGQSVTDLMGNPLAADYTWNFGTFRHGIYLPLVLKGW